MEFHAHGATHQGLVRPGNEDAFVCGRRVFAVADGLGGHVAGEVASRVALGPVEALDGDDRDCAGLARALPQAVRDGNRAVIADAEEHPERFGMGTTLTAGVVCGAAVHLAHVGDSRAYLLRPDQGLRQLTTDHTPVAEAVAAGLLSPDDAAVHPERNVLSRVLGLDPHVEVDAPGPEPLQPGDRLLLCSDGLTEVVRDDEIAAVLAEHHEPAAACDALIAAALAGGGPDNVTVVVGVAGASG